MKLQLPLVALLALSFAACNSDTTTTSSTTTDTAMVAPGADPNMITTTTTTTTTRPAFQPRPNVQYMDLRTRKMVTVRVDTVHHYIVNTQTNEPVDWLMEPGTTDTVYGRNMQMANGYINYGSGTDWSYDESRNAGSMTGGSGAGGDATMTSGGQMMSTEPEKVKTNGNETKVKYSDGSKMKVNDNEVKVKDADGSKMKSNGNETKIKNK